MTLIEILAIIIIHWIADFILQDEKWALGKSKNLNDLTTHTVVYSVLWWFPMSIMLHDFRLGVLFILITFIAHTITDYFTSRIVSKRFEKEVIFNLKVSSDIFKEGDVIQHGSNKLIIMNQYENESKVKWYNSIPNFGAFTIIGLDQCFHMIQLFTTYYFLMK